jgi:cytochrome P450
MSELGLEVMMRVVFGVTDNERLAQARSLLGKIAQIKPTVIVGFRYPWLNRVGPWRRFQQLMRETDLLIYTEIATRRDLPDLADRPDVLSKLLAADSSLTDSQLRDNLVTLLLAGHETTAATLAWALHDLARSPRVLARVRCAADENDEAYLEATVKEAMRRRPVIRSATRRLAKPVQVAGYVLPAGIDVLPSILLAHQSPSLYPSPDEFRPERFLGSTPPPATWIPFGGGIRRCLGAALATIQVQAVLKVVLRNVDITAVGPPESEKIRNVTTVPGRGALIISRPR